MLWCNLLQCFCYLMAFLVIFDSQFILIYTKKSTPTTPLDFWLAAQKIMASLTPPPPPQKRTPFWSLLKSSHPCCASLYRELTLFFLFFSCKHGKKLHCFVNRHCKPRISSLCCLFFFLGFLPIVPYLGYFWWVSSLLSSSDWFEGLCKCGTFL